MQPGRAPRPQNGSYLHPVSSNAPSRINYLRRMNARVRFALLFTALISLTVLFVNITMIRLDQPDVLKLVGGYLGRGMLSDEYSRRERVIERLRHGYGEPMNLPQKIVHIDLKGAPLSVSYLEQVMPFLRKLGATGLLIEYEDMFPYSGMIANLSARNSYSEGDIRRILLAAETQNLSVIPLVQTFGHLGGVLKLEEFKALREVPNNPQAICPSRNASTVLITEMLTQVARLHADRITHIHIGSDEVYALGECDLCRTRLRDNKWQKSDLFMAHVTSVVGIVQKLGYQAIIWDDMFRNVEEGALKNSPLAKLVEIMVWDYGRNVDLYGTFSKYVTSGFRGMWIASAFKGGTSPVNQMPQYERHLLNHHSWMQFLKQFEDKIQVKGIAITGWQRFDHFGPLCELFPVGMPVLALCLAYLQTGKLDDQALAAVKSTLRCNRIMQFEGEIMSAPAKSDGYDSSPPLLCVFPGSKVLFDVLHWDELRQQKKDILNTNYMLVAMSAMNRKRVFSAPLNVEGGTRELPELISRITKLGEVISRDLAEVTDRATAREWVETFIEPMTEPLVKISEDALLMLARNTWPRRPLYNESQP